MVSDAFGTASVNLTGPDESSWYVVQQTSMFHHLDKQYTHKDALQVIWTTVDNVGLDPAFHFSA